MAHLSMETLAELATGAASLEAHAHLERCEACRGEVSALSRMVSELGAVEVPEPSPLYWEAFRRHVGRRIEGERQPTGRRFLFWPALLAAAAVFLALGLRIPNGANKGPEGGAVVPAWSALAEDAQESELVVMQAMVESGVPPSSICDDMDECLEGLSEAELSSVAEGLRVQAPGRSL